MIVVTCDIVAKAFPECPGCCGSCHEDADEYGYSMSGDEENFSVCCTVARFLQDMDISPYHKVTDPTLLIELQAIDNAL